MVEVVVREASDGRFEVEAPGRHYEAFEGRLGAVCVAHALVSEIVSEGGDARLVDATARAPGT